MTKLTKAERATLDEMRLHNDRGRKSYPFRQATCRRLFSSGLASIDPETGHRKRPRFYITPAGRLALSQEKNDD